MCLLFFLKLLDVLGQQSDLDFFAFVVVVEVVSIFLLLLFFFFFFAAYLLLPHLEYHNYAVCSCLSSRYA